jgi:predicted GNAT superfamily acetyltransferase
MNSSITIRRAETVADFQACQEAQRRAWGISEDHYVVPVATMVGAQHHGGLVLGAFLPSGEAVGMSFAFLGRIDGRVGLYSQLTGVVPGYQDQGIGYRLKTFQREAAWAEGVPYIAWAFDPLQAGNARFNLDKLGATAVRFIENMYGPRSDALNRNTPTDRLIAVWETDPGARHDHRPDPLASSDFPRVIALVSGPNPGAPEPTYAGVPEAAPGLLLEIPSDINGLRADAPDLAGRWGDAVRQAFLAAFAAGYRAVGFLRDETAQGRRCYYVLQPGPGGGAA